MRLLLLFAVICAHTAFAQKKVVCYYTNWSGYRQGDGQFTPDNVDPNLCTHIIYAFSILSENMLTAQDPWIDLDPSKDYYHKVVGLKAQNPSLKVMVAIGGWNMGGTLFSQMARSADTRKKFADSVVSFLQKYKFDGLDLDWEYPTTAGGIPEDKKNFILLIQDLQAAFSRQGGAKLLLSAAVNPAETTASQAYDRQAVCSGLDFVNLMEYDFHGTWESFTGLLAPLYASPKESQFPNFNIAITIKQWLNAGCSASKLILGLPLYASAWTLAGSSVEVGAPASGKARAGQYTGQDGVLAYYEICQKLKGGWKENIDQAAQHPYAYGGGEWASYDNEKSLAVKAQYINAQGLGGAMVWSLDFDDFTGKFCSRGKYPLLNAINSALRGSVSSRMIEPDINTPPVESQTPPTQPQTPPTQPPTPPTPSQTQTDTPKDKCADDFTCPSWTKNSRTAYMADPCDTHSYYKCVYGRPIKTVCPRNQQFNISKKRCSFSQRR